MKKRKIRLKKKVKKFLLLAVFFSLLIYLVCNIFDFKTPKSVKDKINNLIKTEIPDINIEDEHIYLLVEDEYSVFIDDTRIKYESSDDNVVTVNNGIVKAVGVGESTVTVSGGKKSDSLIVTVTDLITKPVIDDNKKKLTCGKYNESDAKLLDELLEYRIKQAGYQTRAGAVAAARFLVLEFPYKISYFYENGRLLTNDTRPYVDGEGRYYHKGLYLSSDKYKSLKANMHGPKMWGCEMYSRVTKRVSPNGMDCSGYVSWALFNAGFDVGDAGAGINVNKTNDLDDLGEKLKITKENLALNRVKVGDLVSAYGHIGILIGKDDKNYYIAESLDTDIHVLTLTQDELIKSDWLSFVLMDEVYKNDGKLNNMW